MASRPRKPESTQGSIEDTLAKSRISLDLVAEFEDRDRERESERKKRGRTTASAESRARASAAPETYNVIIEFNRSYPGGISAARMTLLDAYRKARADLDAATADRLRGLAASTPQAAPNGTSLAEAFGPGDVLDIHKSLWTDNYAFGALTKATIGKLAAWVSPVAATASQQTSEPVPLVYKIWLDQKIQGCVYVSRRTVKCDAAIASFAANGENIVWAVADTGVDGRHPHFKTFDTLRLPEGLQHMDYTMCHGDNSAESSKAALTDSDGHGTHVAGIIAGMTSPKDKAANPALAPSRLSVKIEKRREDGLTATETEDYRDTISGVAPKCKILSIKVLKSRKQGDLSNLLAAIAYIQRQNDHGRHIKIHGLNLSLGYHLNALWFAAGQSPLCVDVDRLVRSGVCVVVAAGNGGYGTVSVLAGGSEQAAHLGTISDPGNAELAITVGSTHRDMPHSYGISFFSGKGPTSDGRMKPDLVAPGERIVSCAPLDGDSEKDNVAPFRAQSGTSMAAPHVSGAIAAFLSVREEFKGRPEAVKEIFVRSATDLKRRPEFQGAGLLDLMRALQSV